MSELTENPGEKPAPAQIPPADGGESAPPEPAHPEAAHPERAHPEPASPEPAPPAYGRSFEPPPAHPAPSRAPLVIAVLALLIALAVGGWAWQSVTDLEDRLEAVRAAGVTPDRVAALEASIQENRKQLDAIAARKPTAPAAAQVDLSPLASRLAALEQRLQAVPAPADLSPLDKRVAALEQRPAPAAPPPPPPPSDDPALQSRLSDLNGRIEALGRKLDEAQKSAANLGQKLTEQTERARQIEAAQLALAAGRPVGTVPGAPPSLAKFATTPPPTEASLRLSFEDAAHAAMAASDPAAGSTSFGDRVLARVQSLVTVRQGDHVLVGTPAATVLAEARHRLEAGDISRAVASLDKLDPAAAKAMAGWRAQAQALLDARAALAQLAAAN